MEPSWCLANGVIEATLMGNNVGNLSNIQYSLEGTTEDGRHVTVQAQKTPVFQNLAPGRYTVIVDANCQNVSNQPVRLQRDMIDVRKNRMKLYVDVIRKTQNVLGNSGTVWVDIYISDYRRLNHLDKINLLKVSLKNLDTQEVIEVPYSKDTIINDAKNYAFYTEISDKWKIEFKNIAAGSYEIIASNGCEEQKIPVTAVEDLIDPKKIGGGYTMRGYFYTKGCPVNERFIKVTFPLPNKNYRNALEIGVQFNSSDDIQWYDAEQVVELKELEGLSKFGTQYYKDEKKSCSQKKK